MSTAYDTAPRLSLISTSLQAGSTGIVRSSGVTVSVRHHEGMLITPRHLPDKGMTADDIVYVHDTGKADGVTEPAPDWRLHLGVQAARSDLTALLRVQSPAATALAMLRRDLPAIHPLIARTGGNVVRCTDYVPLHEPTAAELALEALDGHRACLLGSQGLLVGSATPAGAWRLAGELEQLCDQYLRALAVGDPVILTEAELVAATSSTATGDADADESIIDLSTR